MIIDDTTPEREARWTELAKSILSPDSPWMVQRRRHYSIEATS